MCEDPADAAPSSWRRCAGVGSRSPAHQVHLHPELEDRKGAWRKRRWAKKHARKTGPKVDGPLVSTSGPSVFPEPVGAPPRDRRSHALTNGLRARSANAGGPQPLDAPRRGAPVCAVGCREVSPATPPRRSSASSWTREGVPGARSPFRAPGDEVSRGARDTDARATTLAGNGVARHMPAQIRMRSEDFGDVHRTMMRGSPREIG